MGSLDKLKTSRARQQRHLASDSHVKTEEYMAAYGPLVVDRRPPAICSKPQQPAALDPYKSTLPAIVRDGWLSGPVEEQGLALDVSERPILCSATNSSFSETVLGSADHAAYVLDNETLQIKRQLYNKRNGHTEWVTAVEMLPDGSVLSGGMDSKLCLWSRTGVRALDLQGHTAPISEVVHDPATSATVSASYDRTLRTWRPSGTPVATLAGHSAPVLQLALNRRGGALSGDRSGTALLWDLEAGACAWQMKRVHRGHVTAAAFVDAAEANCGFSGCFGTGGQDGVLRLWDAREHGNPVKAAVHADDAGTGAVNAMLLGGAATGYNMATAGADKTLRLLDFRGALQELACVVLPDFPYSLTAAGGVLVVGCGNGDVVVVDTATMKTLYTLQASTSAVRVLEVAQTALVCSGDDGHARMYTFQ